MSEAEMAQALDCAPGTVKSRLSRAMARLRESLSRAAPLVVIPINLESWLAHGLPDAATALHPVSRPELLAAIVHHITSPVAAGGSGAAGSGRSTTQHVATLAGAGGVVIAAVAAVGLLLSASREPPPPPTEPAAPATVIRPTPAVAMPATPAPPPPAPSGAVVYGGDLTDAQRDELQQRFGTTAQAFPPQVVSRSDLVAALQAARAAGRRQRTSDLQRTGGVPIARQRSPRPHRQHHRYPSRGLRERDGHRWRLRRHGHRRRAQRQTDDWRDRPGRRSARVSVVSRRGGNSAIPLAASLRGTARDRRVGRRWRRLGPCGGGDAARDASNCDLTQSATTRPSTPRSIRRWPQRDSAQARSGRPEPSRYSKNSRAPSTGLTAAATTCNRSPPTTPGSGLLLAE